MSRDAARLKYVGTKNQCADILTKSFTRSATHGTGLSHNVMISTRQVDTSETGTSFHHELDMESGCFMVVTQEDENKCEHLPMPFHLKHTIGRSASTSRPAKRTRDEPVDSRRRLGATSAGFSNIDKMPTPPQYTVLNRAVAQVLMKSMSVHRAEMAGAQDLLTACMNADPRSEALGALLQSACKINESSGVGGDLNEYLEGVEDIDILSDLEGL